MKTDIATLSDQADESRPSGMSPRLDAVIAQLPKYQRSRMACGLFSEGVRTLADLCATKRTRLQRLRNVGKRSLANLENTLETLGLSLADQPRPLNSDTNTLPDQADESRPSGMSPRLDAVIAALPKHLRVRMAYGLYSEGVRTLADLCATKQAQLQRLKNVGKRSIANLENTLATLGLSLADRPRPLNSQTPAERVTSSVWLCQQMAQLIADCDENITEDQEHADKARDDTRRAKYEASIDCHRHLKNQLARILTGKTSAEALADTLSTLEVQP